MRRPDRSRRSRNSRRHRFVDDPASRLMGSRQVVRHRSLEPTLGGSNPPSPGGAPHQLRLSVSPSHPLPKHESEFIFMFMRALLTGIVIWLIGTIGIRLGG